MNLTMAHVLNKLTGVELEDVKKQLELDASSHAEQGMYLEHLWRNADDPNEILFIFRVDDRSRCKELMERICAEARKENPDVKLPEKLFLEEA